MSKANLLQNEYMARGIKLNYYEIKNTKPALILLHAQGTNALSFESAFDELAKSYHVFSIDCPGHGLSNHDKCNYNIAAIGTAIVDFIENVAKEPAYIAGHSSGGLIAAFAAANTQMCAGLILEDPPFFSCQGERRFKTYNYIDLSTVCNKYIEEGSQEDFVLYYFRNQKMWSFFPEKSREKIKGKLEKSAQKYRMKHPEKSLKVPFFPKSALSAYSGMNEYDPLFGRAFYNDSFHAGISHEDILKKISCRAMLMKAQTNYNDENILMAAMSEEDAQRARGLLKNCEIARFDCGHGIHIERKKEFIKKLRDFANQK